MDPFRVLASFAALCTAIVAFGACGGSVETPDGAGAASASAATGSGPGATTSGGAMSGPGAGVGGGVPSGECNSDAACPKGKCIELTPGGYTVCAVVPDPAKECTMPMPPVPDQCCTSADCMSGACYKSSSVPYCGGGVMPEYNLCVADQCATDADCIHDNPDPWICYPKGAFGYPATRCGTAYCHTSADCTMQANGVCAPVANPCCGLPYGLACVYPGGCTNDTDCSTDFSQHCEIDSSTGVAACKPGGIGCPA